ncbi:MAG: AraC family ligand binding domain-containing protein [Verrucomicrobia bacterium]|nr:AraC family ligand binding domain-containing protein [Verrucomicrobiota bacterium]
MPVKVIREPLFFDCVPRWSWQAAALKNWMIWAVLRGKGSMLLHGKNHDLFEGVVFILRPGDVPVAYHEADNPLWVYTVHFEPLAWVTEWSWQELPVVHTLFGCQ